MLPRTTYRVVVGLMALWLAELGTHPVAAQTVAPAPEAPIPLLPAEQAWLVTLAASPSAGGAMDDEQVYVPLSAMADDAGAEPQAGTEQIVALDRETGEPRWTRDLATRWPPVTGHGMVFVAATDAIHALDPVTGQDRWRSAIAGPAMSPPRLAGGLLILAVAGGGVLAVRADDGIPAWHQSIGGSEGPASMLVDGEALYLALPGSRVVRLSVRDGGVVWKRTLAGTLGQPAIARDRVLVGSTDDYLYALDPGGGRFEWRYPAGGDVVGATADREHVFFVALDNVLRALSRGSGNQRWKALLTTRPSASPRTFGGLVLVAGLSPALSAFDAKTGAPLGTYTAPSLLAGPALVDPLLNPLRVAIVAITGDGRVVGLRPTHMMFREPAPVPLTALPGRTLEPDANP